MRRLSRRRRLSMTSLIDVIFLLLLFFMLTSTFTRFADVELATGGSGGGTSEVAPVFVQLGPETLRVNGEAVALEDARAALQRLRDTSETAPPVLLALGDGVTAQRLTDALGMLRGVEGVDVTVLGGA